jgi:hypothetical protein
VPRRQFAVDGRRPPSLAGRAGNLLLVERVRDRIRGFAGGIGFENVPDDHGLVLIDPALTTRRLSRPAEIDHDVVAIKVAPAGPAGLDGSAQAAARLVGEVLQIQRAHRAFETDVELADRAFRERRNLSTGKTQALVDPGDVLLIARDAVEGTPSGGDRTSRPARPASASGCRGASGSSRRWRNPGFPVCRLPDASLIMRHSQHKASLRGPTEGPNRPEPTREATPSLILTFAPGFLSALERFSVDHGRTSPVGLPSIVALDAHAGSGSGRGLSRSIRRRISANSARGSATSASWNTT